MNAPYTNRALASSAALISGCLGVYTAVVWLVDRWHLATLGPDQIPMAPMTAAMFVLLALALGVRIYRPADRTTESASLACALLVTLICALELTRPVWGWSLPWDHWRSTLVTKTGELEIGRISPLTAINFLLATAVMLAQSPALGQSRLAGWWANLGAASGVLIATLITLAYAAGTPLGYDRASVPMALLTAVAFLFLNAGLLLAERERKFRQARLSHPDGESAEWRNPRFFSWKLLLGLTGFLGACGLAWFYYSRHEQAAIRLAVEEQLTAIGDLKVREISEWRKERLSDAQVFAATADLPQVIARLASGSSEHARLDDFLATLLRAYRYRRIVLFDTLMAQLGQEEVEAVLAHEIGHYKRGHIPQRLVTMALMQFGAFATIAWLANAPWFNSAFGLPAGVLAPTFLLFGLLGGLVTFWFSPIGNRVSRKHEYEADAFAKDAMNGAAPLVGALRKLSQKNLSNLTPHPLYSAMYYSHPTLVERERALNS